MRTHTIASGLPALSDRFNINDNLDASHQSIQAMLRMAKKSQLEVGSLAFSRSIIREMPMWDHLFTQKNTICKLMIKSDIMECLV